MNVMYEKLFIGIYYIVTLEITFQIQCKVLYLKIYTILNLKEGYIIFNIYF